jgi:hypothetical protein
MRSNGRTFSDAPDHLDCRPHDFRPVVLQVAWVDIKTEACYTFGFETVPQTELQEDVFQVRVERGGGSLGDLRSYGRLEKCEPKTEMYICYPVPDLRGETLGSKDRNRCAGTIWFAGLHMDTLERFQA